MDNVQSHFVNVDGCRTHYLEAGFGTDTLVLLHGTSLAIDARSTWYRTIPTLACHFRVIALDLFGFGQTDGHYVVGDDRRRHARSFLQTLRLQEVALVGHSEGGITASWIASSHPELVRKLIVVASSSTAPSLGHGLDDGWIKASQDSYNYVNGANTETGFIEMNSRLSTTNPPEFVDMMRQNYADAVARGQLDQLRAACQHPNYLMDMTWKEEELYPKLATMRAKVLLVWALDDDTAPVSRGARLLQCIPRSQLHVFNNAAHMVMLDRAEDFNSLLCWWITHP